MSESRESRSQARVRVRRRAFIAVPLAIAVLAAGGYFLFRGGQTVLHRIVHHDTTPGFEFQVTKTQAIPISSKAKQKKLNAAADAAVKDAYQPIDDLYTYAFLDPGNWKSGNYEKAWALFDEAAAAQAQQDIDILTLGTTAGDAFKTVQPGASKLAFKVLTTANAQPNTIVAFALFRADAPRKDGQVTHVFSEGQFFLHDTGDGWKIFSYKVTRNDETTAPAPGPSGSGSPSGASS